MNDEDWEAFASAWQRSMTGFRDGNLTQPEAVTLILKFEKIVDKEIAQFACNVVAEIDGYPEEFDETLALLQNKPSRQEVLRYMNS